MCTLVQIFILSCCAHIVDLPRFLFPEQIESLLCFSSRLTLREGSMFNFLHTLFRMYIKVIIQLSATDLLALASMKNAAKCDK